MTASKAPHPSLGTWKLTKCETSRPDLPHPVSGIVTITEEGDTIHYDDDHVWSDGQTSKASVVYKVDGNWWPVTGSTLIDSLSARRLEDGSSVAKMKKDGVDVGTVRARVSEDGRTLIRHWEFVGPGDTTVTWKTTTERQ